MELDNRCRFLYGKMKPKFNDKIDRPVVGENVFIKTTSILGILSVIKVPVLDD